MNATKRKRRPPALAARILTAGLSVSLSLGLVSAFALSWKKVNENAAVKPPAVQSAPQIVTRYVHVPAKAATSPRTVVTRGSSGTPSTRRTSTRTTVTRVQSAPAPAAPPATTTHGS